MSRTIPPALQANLDAPVQHTARLIQIRARSGVVFGAAMWDRDIVYDDNDGAGPVVYSASTSFDPSTIMAAVDYSVANSQGRLFAKTEFPELTTDAVRAGVLDDAQWKCLLVDWRDPQPGSAAILDAGDIGEVRIEDELVIIPDLLSFIMRLYQPVGHNASVRCRAVFGAPAGSMTGCGVSTAGMWADDVVTSVDPDEPDRTFFGTDAVLFPGRLEWTTGRNVGRRYSIEIAGSTRTVLAEPMPFPIEIGDGYRFRADCTKLKTGVRGCDWYDNYVNFKGEDRIPVGEGVTGSVPGAQSKEGGGYESVILDGDGFPVSPPAPDPAPSPSDPGQSGGGGISTPDDPLPEEGTPAPPADDRPRDAAGNLIAMAVTGSPRIDELTLSMSVSAAVSSAIANAAPANKARAALEAVRDTIGSPSTISLVKNGVTIREFGYPWALNVRPAGDKIRVEDRNQRGSPPFAAATINDGTWTLRFVGPNVTDWIEGAVGTIPGVANFSISAWDVSDESFVKLLAIDLRAPAV